ncbi:NAD(P)-dependent oxidoreductase [Pararobbsia alpina]|uniref:dihydrouracil dehydrogenase (NAD(+)) n=1 Tax=Pararobbsia alpina TaxID=621374 RepID=A0A6S7B315_9BURK|nr:NAD(P)-dependent oxidoreductase [Pararobbsia alpina]CAB3786126.1 NAD-dependent dihydropyrimidine dehydrogenase subunit PreT [Pararobbsia alpina]
MRFKETGDIAAGRLSAEQLGLQFADVAPPLSRDEALVEANRCYFCYDAPCITACPTGIDIPAFIRKIQTDNLKGAAKEILSANPLGGMCARVCPTEILCEGSCVRNAQESKPVQIGALQRHATDWIYESDVALFKRAPETGRRIAVVGAGPAGLACAHKLALLGHRVTIYDARAKGGGLNEYGIAAYKTVDDFAQREIDWLLSVGGIDLKCGVSLGTDVSLAQLRKDYDAVFLSIGLSGVNALGVEGDELPGVQSAVDFIETLRQASDLTALPVGRRVVVIGGGNTAVDAAVQSRKLGAQSVTMVYRRGVESMSATWAEREFAQKSGVTLIEHARPVRILAVDGIVTGVLFEQTVTEEGRLKGTGDTFEVAADTIFKAIGQTLVSFGTGFELLATVGGKIEVDAQGATSVAGVWAGGDCAQTGIDLTVQAVEDGKRAAQSIDRALTASIAGSITQAA